MTRLFHSWPDHSGHVAQSSSDSSSASTILFEYQPQIIPRQDNREDLGLGITHYQAELSCGLPGLQHPSSAWVADEIVSTRVQASEKAFLTHKFWSPLYPPQEKQSVLEGLRSMQRREMEFV